MKPIHRPRLPVSKPNFGSRVSGDREPQPLPESQRPKAQSVQKVQGALVSSSSTVDAQESAMRTAANSAAHQRPTVKVAQSSSRPPVSSPAGIPLAIPVVKPIVVADAIEIVVEPEVRRPFELGDILTREFAARNSSFLISLAFHTLVLLLLSLVLIHSTGKALIMLELLSSPDVEQYEGIIAEVDVDINDLEELMAAVNDDPFNAAFGDSDGDQTVTDESQIAGTEGGGDKTQGQGDGKSAKFFGMRAMGNKFVYVLDRSGSMAYESSDVQEYKVSRFDVARLELMNSVESLRPHQEFYVVLFSNGMRQMFDRKALVPTPVNATPENKAKLKEWLWQNRADGGTDPRGSLKLAYKMNPDAIFMLSDGEFRDETNDGNPRSIDIARKQVEESKPIRINSIALEDDSSKSNMQELSTVSGGQFKFVKVKDYISKMASSPADFFRSRLPDQSQVQLAVTWPEREAMAKKLIQLVKSNQPMDRQEAETRLHELSFGIFETVIPSVAPADVDSETIDAVIDAWTEVWAKANDQTNLDTSTPIGLFSTLATVGNKSFLESVESLDIASLPPLDQISVAKSILDYQRSGGGVTDQSKVALLNVLRELNKQSTAEFSENHFLKTATLATCQRRLATVLKYRRLRASRLYAKSKNKKLLEEARIEIVKDLISLYPETKLARQAAEDLNLPVSHRNETK